MKLKYVLFDWDGTLGLEGERGNFIRAKTKEKKLEFLQIYVYQVLKHLHHHNIPMGILSNTQIDAHLIREAMDVAGLSKFFTLQLYTSENKVPGQKPEKITFDYAFSQIKKQYPNMEIENVLYVGNSYIDDILGAWNANMYTAYIVNKSLVKYYVAMSLPLPTFVLYTMKDLLEVPLHIKKN
jgi:FMN phosphatase YigB (HAD superfamily)